MPAKHNPPTPANANEAITLLVVAMIDGTATLAVGRWYNAAYMPVLTTDGDYVFVDAN